MTSTPFDLGEAPRWARAAMLSIGAWFFATHLMHAFSEAINWDEFALMQRADLTLRLGDVVGGSRPGLVTIILMPFVRDCIDAVQAVTNARLFWQLLTLAYLAGVYQIVHRWFLHACQPRSGRLEGLLAVMLLAFLPAFVTWSVQVRTDQAALAASIWGGVFLLSSTRRSALLAGALFAIALLCTQKAIYVIALSGLLFLTASWARLRPWSAEARCEARTLAVRCALVAASAAGVIALYVALVPHATHLASGDAVASGLEVMRWTRERQGYRVYMIHAPRLLLHWVLFGALLIWTARLVARRCGDSGEALPVVTSWLVLLLGLAVIRFHGSSFPYFIMTAGLFPAIALAMNATPVIARAGRMNWLVLVSAMALAALQSAPESIEMLADTQLEQRETLRLVHGSDLRNRRGYQVEGALFCARDPNPIPAMFSQDIARHFRMSPQSAENTAQFIAEFRNRPVAYLVESYRLRQFPAEINRFFANHYVWYGKSLYLAGFRLDFTDHGEREVEVIVPARYRWTPDPGFRDRSLLLDGRPIAAFGEVELAVGTYRVYSPDSALIGSLILADLPASEREGYPSFYHQRQILQLGGRR